MYGLNLLFINKKAAENAYRKLNNFVFPSPNYFHGVKYMLKCTKKSHERVKSRSFDSVFVEMEWVIFKSLGTAGIFFRNDYDPQVALFML